MSSNAPVRRSVSGSSTATSASAQAQVERTAIAAGAVARMFDSMNDELSDLRRRRSGSSEVGAELKERFREKGERMEAIASRMRDEAERIAVREEALRRREEELSRREASVASSRRSGVSSADVARRESPTSLDPQAAEDKSQPRESVYSSAPLVADRSRKVVAAGVDPPLIRGSAAARSLSTESDPSTAPSRGSISPVPTPPAPRPAAAAPKAPPSAREESQESAVSATGYAFTDLPWGRQQQESAGFTASRSASAATEVSPPWRGWRGESQAADE
eukprot:Hpha_TRINITY_DN35944_c0_g1::TRINITY_DN35944_c0_g1_i1::g.184857::m.184857